VRKVHPKTQVPNTGTWGTLPALERIFQFFTKLIVAGMSHSISRQELIIPTMEKTGWICIKLKPTA
jgi:hypothetical protein